MKRPTLLCTFLSTVLPLALPLACDRAPDAEREGAPPERASPAEEQAKAEQVKAEQAKAEQATAESPKAQPSAKPSTSCVRPGTYRITSDGPFYLADDAGKLPPKNKRKVRTDEIHDCSAHAFLWERVAVQASAGGVRVAVSEGDGAEFSVTNVEVDGCRLTFDAVNPYEVARAHFALDFSEPAVTGRASDIWLEIMLDGEMGENQVSCAADSIDLRVDSDGASPRDETL